MVKIKTETQRKHPNTLLIGLLCKVASVLKAGKGRSRTFSTLKRFVFWEVEVVRGACRVNLSLSLTPTLILLLEEFPRETVCEKYSNLRTSGCRTQVLLAWYRKTRLRRWSPLKTYSRFRHLSCFLTSLQLEKLAVLLTWKD